MLCKQAAISPETVDAQQNQPQTPGRDSGTVELCGNAPAVVPGSCLLAGSLILQVLK
jgi:hypothetical protein